MNCSGFASKIFLFSLKKECFLSQNVEMASFIVIKNQILLFFMENSVIIELSFYLSV